MGAIDGASVQIRRENRCGMLLNWQAFVGGDDVGPREGLVADVARQ